MGVHGVATLREGREQGQRSARAARGARGPLGLAALVLLVFGFCLITVAHGRLNFDVYRIDLDVYRLGAHAWLTGHHLYGKLPPPPHGPGLRLPHPPLSPLVVAP